MNADHLLKIVQQPHQDLASRYGFNALSQVCSINISFRYACIAELQHFHGVRVDLNTISRSIVLSESSEGIVSPSNILSDISLSLEEESPAIYLKDSVGNFHKSTEISLWFACTICNQIVLGEHNINLLAKLSKIEDLISNKGRLEKWPRKRERQSQILCYLQEIFERNRKYTEKEVNEAIVILHNDYSLIRRALVSEGYLARTKDGALYWREDPGEFSGE